MLGFVLPPVLYLKAYEEEFSAAIASCCRPYNEADGLTRGSIGRGSIGRGSAGREESAVWDTMSRNDEEDPPGASQQMQKMTYTSNPMMTYDSLDPRRGSTSLDELDFDLMSNAKRRVFEGTMDQMEIEDISAAPGRDEADDVPGLPRAGYTTLNTSHGRGSSGDGNGWVMGLQCSPYKELLPFITPICMILFGFMSLLVGITSVILDNS